MLTKVMVMDNGACIGVGYVFQTFTGETFRPVLFDLKGEPLAEGWYQLQPTDDRQLAIAPMRMQ